MSGFLNYINNFRGIAILYIIIIHTVSAFNWVQSPLTKDILYLLLTNGSILFVFIAGYLFQHLSETYEIKKYLKTKFKYVVMPYLICAIPATIYFVWYEVRWDVPYWLYNYSKFGQILWLYLLGKSLVPYWFLPMIFIYYLFSPVLIWLDKKKTIYWFIPIFCIISVHVGRGLYPYQNFVYFFPVFLFGMFFSRFRLKTMQIISSNIYLSLSIVTVLLIYFFEFKFNFHGASFIEKNLLCTIYLSLLYKYDHILNSSFDFLAKTSFGMYFVHSYFVSIIKLLYKQKYGDYFNGTILNYMIFTVFIITVCYLTIYYAKKIMGKYSRFIIGS